MEFFFRIYSENVSKYDSIKSKLIRFTIKILLNLFLPIYYRLNKKHSTKKIDIIVSLTSFPKRINRLWIVIESILRQTSAPKKIVLTLSKLQFVSEKSLPKKLLNLKSRGLLEIIWTENDLRSHKKYFFSMQAYPDDIIVTVDDDFIYGRKMLETLYAFHKKNPYCIITNLALQKKGSDYNKWENLFFLSKEPSYSIMQFGGSGVLYPKSSLHPDAFDIEIILNDCPLADDIWLNTMAILNSTKIQKTDYLEYPIPLLYISNRQLYKENVIDNKNNDQIKNLEHRYRLNCIDFIDVK